MINYRLGRWRLGWSHVCLCNLGSLTGNHPSICSSCVTEIVITQYQSHHLKPSFFLDFYTLIDLPRVIPNPCLMSPSLLTWKLLKTSLRYVAKMTGIFSTMYMTFHCFIQLHWKFPFDMVYVNECSKKLDQSDPSSQAAHTKFTVDSWITNSYPSTSSISASKSSCKASVWFIISSIWSMAVWNAL